MPTNLIESWLTFVPALQQFVRWTAGEKHHGSFKLPFSSRQDYKKCCSPNSGDGVFLRLLNLTSKKHVFVVFLMLHLPCPILNQYIYPILNLVDQIYGFSLFAHVTLSQMTHTYMHTYKLMHWFIWTRGSVGCTWAQPATQSSSESCSLWHG